MSTETDRELLEWAAKAAGMRVEWIGDNAFDCTRLGPRQPVYKGDMWSPLYEDGDALRLAVKLALRGGFVVGISGDSGSTAAADHSECEGAEVKHEGDPYAATRRAITRAAAEIGKGIP